MLKRNIGFVFCLAGLIWLASCAKDGDDSPFDPSRPSVEVQTTVSSFFDTLAYSSDHISLETLDLVTFDLSITAEGGFLKYYIVLSVDGAVADTLIEVEAEDLEAAPGTTAISDRRSFEIPSELVGTTATFEFRAYDQLEQEGNTKVELTVESPKARYYSDVILQVTPLGELSSANFFNSRTGLIYSSAQVSEGMLSGTIDFGYYYGVNDSASIASPKGFEKTNFLAQVAQWSVKNATSIRSTQLRSLEEIERFDDIDLVYLQGVDESGIATNLIKDQVIAFETVSGKRGLILVKDIVDGDQDALFNGAADYIELDIVVQERTAR